MKRLLLTGGTGAIGSVLCGRLLEDPNLELHILLRGSSDEVVQERGRELRHSIDPTSPADDHRVWFHRGDVTEPNLGWNRGLYRRLSTSLTHIVHCAGNVRLNNTLDEARRDALIPCQQILSLVRDAAEHGPLQKVEYVSTIGVAGCTPGCIPETQLSVEREFHNTYEHAKAEAEQLVWRAVEQPLPITIHRPSMVVGDHRTGQIRQFQVFYHLCQFLSGTRTWGWMPQLGSRCLDIIPVNIVADAILSSLSDNSTSGRVLHLCSGPQRAVALPQLRERFRDYCQQLGRRLPPIRSIPRWVLRAVLPAAGWCLPAKTGRQLRTLPHFLRYLDESQQFDVSQTQSYLTAQGIAIPDPGDYLEILWDYYFDHRTRSRSGSQGSSHRALAGQVGD